MNLADFTIIFITFKKIICMPKAEWEIVIDTGKYMCTYKCFVEDQDFKATG